MSDELRIESLLRQEADQISVDPRIPPRVHRRIRVRQGATLAFATISVMAVALAAFALPNGERDIPPAGNGGQRGEGVLVTSRVDGVRWEMELRNRSTGNGRVRELICVGVGKRRQCWNIDESNRYGEANVIVDHVKALDRALIIVKTPPKGDFSIREVSGTLWSGMVASEGDEAAGRPAYWYRLFDSPEVHGIVSVFGANAPRLEVSVEVNGETVQTSVSRAAEEFPELSGFPGDKELVASGPEAGGYSVFRRTTDSEVCLHTGEAVRCRNRNADMEPIRLWVAESLRCTPNDQCGSDGYLTVVAGEVGEEVARIGIRDRRGTSFVHVGEPYGEGTFSTTIDGRLGIGAELVAFDSEGNEMASEPLEF